MALFLCGAHLKIKYNDWLIWLLKLFICHFISAVLLSPSMVKPFWIWLPTLILTFCARYQYCFLYLHRSRILFTAMDPAGVPDVLNPVISKSDQSQTAIKLPNFILQKCWQIKPCERIVKEALFVWSYHRISSKDSKIRTTWQDSIFQSQLGWKG